MIPTPPRHRRVTVSGRVQGVCFRDWTVETARRLGLAGWVRNRRDGSVEAHVAGDDSAIDAFAAACRHGPPAARVDAVAIVDAAAEPLDDFVRRPTG